MPLSGDERQISLEEVISAAATHELAALAERLTRERSWASLTVLFHYAGGPRTTATLEEVRAAAEAVRGALRGIPVPKRATAAIVDQIRSARLASAEALLARSSHPPVGEVDRRSVRLAGDLLSEAADHRRAALAYEEIDDDSSAAQAYGAMGDLDRMEASLAREEARLRTRRAAIDGMRAFESLMAAGERAAALEAAAGVPPELAAAAAIRQRARQVESRLIRARAVTLRAGGAAASAAFRFASLPAALGRDLLAEVPVRDPGTSRHHALIVQRSEGLMLEDTGSRAGVRVAGALLGAPLPLRGEGELSLGRDCRIRFRADGEERVILRGVAGLDRQLVALVGVDPLPLGGLLAGAGGVWLELGGGVARLCHAPGISVRVDGHFVGAACDLLHGDVIEIRAGGVGGHAPLLIEVE
jgi:hypothetical protein